MSNKKLKFLCVCAGGNVRSHALAYYLKSKGHAAMPIGLDHFGKDELSPLVDWADYVLVVSHSLREKLDRIVRDDQRQKVAIINIGEDKWGPRIPPDLVELSKKLFESMFGWKWDTTSGRWEKPGLNGDQPVEAVDTWKWDPERQGWVLGK